MALNVVVGITGGIAAYKAVNVVRSLVLAGHDVHVVATDAALRFVGRPTLEAISRNPVHTELYEGVAEVRHVAIGQAADLIVIAPATANTIAKLAAGIADDLLGNTVLASTAPLVIAPAMHTEMWQNPATVDEHRDPAPPRRPRRRARPSGSSPAATPVPADSRSPRPSWPRPSPCMPSTRPGSRHPAISPVVVSSSRPAAPASRSTRCASSATAPAGGRASPSRRPPRARGAAVTLIAAHLEVHASELASRSSRSPRPCELQQAVTDAAADADIIVMAAAVADYRPAERRRLQDQEGDAGRHARALPRQEPRHPGRTGRCPARGEYPGLRLVGFAAETEPDDAALLELGRAKIARKGADLLVVNRVGWNEGFATDGNSVVVLDGAGDIVSEAAGSKMSVADRILDAIVALD